MKINSLQSTQNSYKTRIQPKLLVHSATNLATRAPLNSNYLQAYFVGKSFQLPAFGSSNNDLTERINRKIKVAETTQKLCNNIEQGEFEIVKNQLSFLSFHEIDENYYFLTKDENGKNIQLHIFALLCREASKLKKGVLNKNKIKINFLEKLAEKLAKSQDFNPDAVAVKIPSDSDKPYDSYKDTDETLLDFVISQKNDNFASLLLSYSDWAEDINTLKYIKMNRKSIPTTAYVAKLFLNALKPSQTSNIKQYNEIEPYKVTPSKNAPKRLDALGGMFEAKKAAQEFIINPWNPKYRNKILENNLQMPNGFLLYGPPGCGKTFIAMAIANEMNIPMYQIDLGEIGNHFAYKTEKNLELIFKTLEEKYSETGQPSLLFLDEIDTLCADRSKSSTDWKRDQISTLLKLTNNASEKGIILIGATNMLDILDPAILRTGRFDKKIKIELPNTQERLEIIKNLTKERPIAHALLKDLPKIAQLTSGCTCSDINAILQTAMRRAIFEQKNSITLTDVTNAFETLELCTANLK